MNKKSETEQKKLKLLAVWNANGDWRQLAREINIPQSTAYRWVSEGETQDKRGGKRFQKITQIHLDYFVEMIENNCRITLAELTASFQQKFTISISKTTISKKLDSLCYSLKNVRHEPERANCAENKEKRKEFVEKLLEYQSQNKPILFMDETNFNIHISRAQGRSTKGTRCTTVAAGSKGANVHVIGCISTSGFIHYEVRRGSFKKDNAKAWMKTCLRQSLIKLGVPIVMVIDNAPCHSKIEEILQLDEFKENKILRLAPYSPMFNPIENIWSVVKSHVKRELSSKLLSILNNRNTDLTISEQRVRALEGLMEEGLQAVTPTKCANCIAHIQGKVTAALNLEDMVY